MPLNPITGQFEYGGSSYDMPTVGAEMAAMGMGAVGADIPMAFKLMENLPGITAGALFNARRFANTMEKGGYRDIFSPKRGQGLFGLNRQRLAKKAGAFAVTPGRNIRSSVIISKSFFIWKS